MQPLLAFHCKYLKCTVVNVEIAWFWRLWRVGNVATFRNDYHESYCKPADYFFSVIESLTVYLRAVIESLTEGHFFCHCEPAERQAWQSRFLGDPSCHCEAFVRMPKQSRSLLKRKKRLLRALRALAMTKEGVIASLPTGRRSNLIKRKYSLRNKISRNVHISNIR